MSNKLKLDPNDEHDVKLINRLLKDVETELSEIIYKYSTCVINEKEFISNLWNLHFELNSLARPNTQIFDLDKKLTLKLSALYNKVFRYINHHDRLITPQKPYDNNNIEMI